MNGKGSWILKNREKFKDLHEYYLEKFLIWNKKLNAETLGASWRCDL